MITISTDKTKLDVPFIQDFLKDIYWAAGRTIDEVQTTIDSSFCFGIYLNEPVLKNIKIWRLATSDAHFLYEKFGFKALAHPEKMMEKVTI
jgi:hypothetical protein